MLDNSAFYSNTTELTHPAVNSGHSPDLRNATAVILNGVRSGNDKQPSSLTVSQEARQLEACILSFFRMVRPQTWMPSQTPSFQRPDQLVCVCYGLSL